MKTYKITINPLTGFGTPLKGDTLFGHICWQIYYNEDLLGKSLSQLLSDYSTNPFIVVTSAYPEINNIIFLKRPDIPLYMLFDFSNIEKTEVISKRKEIKKKRWMAFNTTSKIESLKSQQYFSDEEIFEKIKSSLLKEKRLRTQRVTSMSIIKEFTQPRNTINRLTGTTGEDQFAPYSVDQISYFPGISLCVFAALRDDINIESIVKILQIIGYTGFGKDASTGLGRFEVKKYEEFDIKVFGSDNPNACYTLSPCVPEKNLFSKVFFSPFVRFGRHGDILAKSGKPFKNPVIMADEGAVFIADKATLFEKSYIGSAVANVSKAEPKAVTQGYSLYIPIKIGGINE